MLIDVSLSPNMTRRRHQYIDTQKKSSLHGIGYHSIPEIFKNKNLIRNFHVLLIYDRIVIGSIYRRFSFRRLVFLFSAIITYLLHNMLYLLCIYLVFNY